MSKKDKATKKGKYYSDGKTAIYADKNYRIESKSEFIEYDELDDLPDNVKDKCKNKDKDKSKKEKS